MAQLDRASLTALVAQLMAGEYTDSDELDRDAARLQSGVLHPGVLDLIFYPDNYFDHEPTADEVVEHALAYRAIEL